MATAFLVLAAIAILPQPRMQGQERPLPDLPTLLRETRAHLRDDWRLDRQYTYVERRTEYQRGDDGREQVKSVKVFEVQPTPGGRPYRRLVEVDGRPLTPQELEQNERERQKRIAEREHESASQRQRRLNRQAAQQREEEETWDDLSRVYSFSIVGRERVDGQQLLVLEFKPKADAQPITENGRRMAKVRGRAWISESDYQVARVDAEVLDDISVGWGLVGKLYAGANASYVRRKLNDQWLPRSLSYAATGRALVKRFAVHQVIEYLDYRKAN